MQENTKGSVFAIEPQDNDAAPALVLDGVTAGYGRTVALEEVRIRVPRGKLTALVGPNGAGKSTLFRVLLGLLRPTAGRVLVDGRDLRAARLAFGYMPQSSQVDLGFPASVRDVVAMGRYARAGVGRRLDAGDWRVVDRSLGQVGLANLADEPIGALSGGQRQRALLARALAQEGSVLLLDEPISSVDVGSQQAILEVLARVAAEGTTVLVATHDLNVVLQAFDEVVCLNRRVVAAGPPATTLSEETLSTTFGHRLVLVQIEGKLYAVDTGAGE
jgi:manganese transport system ATP-binding protein